MVIRTGRCIVTRFHAGFAAKTHALSQFRKGCIDPERDRLRLAQDDNTLSDDRLLGFVGLCKVEQKDFGVLLAFDGQPLFLADCCSIALVQLLAVQFDCAFRDVQPGVSSFG